jgi:hypothetical protein
MIDGLLGLVRFVVATAAAMLPRRYWPRLEPALPVSRAAPAAAIVTLLAAAAIGIPGFFAHLETTVSQNNVAYLEAAERSAAAELPLPSALSGLAIFTFVLLTPAGWISSYLAVSGLIRSIGSQFDDPHGDLLLTLLDAGVRKGRDVTVRRAEIDNRRLLEGPLVRDRIAHGAQFGMDEADLVVVASRIKDGWEPGAVVLSDRGVFRILEVEDRTVGGSLRRLYALARHENLEVFRRAVSYEFPDGNPGVRVSDG